MALSSTPIRWNPNPLPQFEYSDHKHMVLPVSSAHNDMTYADTVMDKGGRLEAYEHGSTWGTAWRLVFTFDGVHREQAHVSTVKHVDWQDTEFALSSIDIWIPSPEGKDRNFHIGETAIPKKEGTDRDIDFLFNGCRDILQLWANGKQLPFLERQTRNGDYMGKTEALSHHAIEHERRYSGLVP